NGKLRSAARRWQALSWSASRRRDQDGRLDGHSGTGRRPDDLPPRRTVGPAAGATGSPALRSHRLLWGGRQHHPAHRPESSEAVMTVATNIGRSFPIGATVVDGGVQFSLFSRTATGVDLLFFDRDDDATPSHVVRIDPVTNRTYYYWHVFVPGVR